MHFSALIASSIITFVAALPAPAPVPAPTESPIDWKTVDYSGVDWKTVSYDVDWKTVDYSNIDWATVDYQVDWKTVNYGGNAAAAPAATSAASAASSAVTPSTTLASSSASATASAAPVGPYQFITSRSGDSAVHLQNIYPASQKLRIGGTAPKSYSPAIQGATLPPPTSSAAYNVGQNGMSLAVSTPGGQAVYVGSDGTLGYTQAHSASTPAGSVSTGFTVGSAGATSYTQLLFNGKAQFLACPVSGESGVYDIVVAEKSTRTDCTGVSVGGAINPSYVDAYQWN